MGSNTKYRVVPMTTLVSPCRGCREGLCEYRDICPPLAAFSGECDQEFSGYGVCDVNIYGEQSAPSVMKRIEKDADEEIRVSEEKTTAAAPIHPPVAEPAPPKFMILAGKAIHTAPTAAPEPETTLIPADMTLDQIFPKKRMAQLAMSSQMSLF